MRANWVISTIGITQHHATQQLLTQQGILQFSHPVCSTHDTPVFWGMEDQKKTKVRFFYDFQRLASQVFAFYNNKNDGNITSSDFYEPQYPNFNNFSGKSAHFNQLCNIMNNNLQG